MLVVFDQHARLWRCRLDSEPGNPVVIAETLEEVLEFLKWLKERRSQCDSDEKNACPN
jgi:hypothetical protein